VNVEDVLDAVRAYLDVAPGEEAFVLATLAAAVSKTLIGEEPLWLFLIGASGGGKTEAIRLPDPVVDQRVDELTRAGLLSRDKKGKRVGLLTKIPRHALVTISDFSTVATMGDHEARARMYGMLRVVYDGSVYRSIGGEVGSDGDELEWDGHLTLIAGATPALDSHTSVEAALGERWLTIRLPESSAARARHRARFVADRGEIPQLRETAQQLARDLVLEARGRIPANLDTAHVDRLVDLATFVSHARTGVQFEGQGKYRVVIGVPTPEEPTRLVGQLQRFARCGIALGLTADDAMELTATVAIDSVPLARMRALRAVLEAGDAGCTVADVHRGLVRGNRWAAIHQLDALEAIGLVDVIGPNRDDDPKATRTFFIASEYRDVCGSVASFSRGGNRGEEGLRGTADGSAHLAAASEAVNGDEPPPWADDEAADILASFEGEDEPHQEEIKRGPRQPRGASDRSAATQ
jgi:hypothetical protein